MSLQSVTVLTSFFSQFFTALLVPAVLGFLSFRFLSLLFVVTEEIILNFLVSFRPTLSINLEGSLKNYVKMTAKIPIVDV